MFFVEASPGSLWTEPHAAQEQVLYVIVILSLYIHSQMHVDIYIYIYVYVFMCVDLFGMFSLMCGKHRLSHGAFSGLTSIPALNHVKRAT